MNWILSILLLGTSTWLPSAYAMSGCAAHGISTAELSQLAGKTSQRVREIREARTIASNYNASLALYGGTSRELFAYICKKLNELGGLQAYEKWLSSTPDIRLMDWHKMQSDLDFLLYDSVEQAADGTSDLERLHQAKASIESHFPGTLFYKKFDQNIPSEFFKRYPVSDEHFEPISNVPVSERGVEHFPDLTVQFKGKTRNLADWGLEQMASGKLEFALNSNAEVDPTAMFLHILRWTRFISENPDVDSSDAINFVKKAMKSLTKKDRAKIIEHLRDGARSHKSRPANKLLASLEKLQLYSKDSALTRSLLDDIGITRICEEAGIAENRILDPLPHRPKRPKAGKRLGKEITLNHRTQLSAAQNIGDGALWMSNNKSVIQDKEMVAAYGAGIYAAEGSDALGYGDAYVKITLSPDAIEDVDYMKVKNFYVILTRDAIARNSDGSFKISSIDSTMLRENFSKKLEHAAKIKSGDLDEEELRSITRTLTAIHYPEVDLADATSFERLVKTASRLKMDDEVYRSYLNRDGVVSRLLTDNSAFAKRIRPKVIELLADPDVLMPRRIRTGGRVRRTHGPGKHPLLRAGILDPEVVLGVPKLRKAFFALASKSGNSELEILFDAAKSPYFKKNETRLLKKRVSDFFSHQFDSFTARKVFRSNSIPVTLTFELNENNVWLFKHFLTAANNELERGSIDDEYFRDIRSAAFQSNPELFIKEFDAQDLPLRTPALRYQNGMVGFQGYVTSEYARGISAVLEKFLKTPQSLTDADLKLSETLVKGGADSYLPFLLNGPPATQQRLLRALTEGIESHGVREVTPAEVFLDPKFFSKNPELQILADQTRPRFIAALETYPELREMVIRRILSSDTSIDPRLFPWDPANERERSILKHAAANRESIRQQLIYARLRTASSWDPPKKTDLQNAEYLLWAPWGRANAHQVIDFYKNRRLYLIADVADRLIPSECVVKQLKRNLDLNAQQDN